MDRDASGSATTRVLEDRLAGIAPVMTRVARTRVRAHVMAGIVRSRVPLTMRRRMAVAAACGCVALAGFSGVGMAAAASLPGNPLYPVKLAMEQVVIRLAPTATLQAAARRVVVARRAAEAVTLEAGGETTAAAGARVAGAEAARGLPHLRHGVDLPPTSAIGLSPAFRSRARAVLRELSGLHAGGSGSSQSTRARKKGSTSGPPKSGPSSDSASGGQQSRSGSGSIGHPPSGGVPGRGRARSPKH